MSNNSFGGGVSDSDSDLTAQQHWEGALQNFGKNLFNRGMLGFKEAIALDRLYLVNARNH